MMSSGYASRSYFFVFTDGGKQKQNVTPRAKYQREYSSNNLRCDI